MFEIKGFSKEVLREFTRRVDIENTMEENGWEGARLASKATLLTRPTKEEHDINILRTDWLERQINYLMRMILSKIIKKKQGKLETQAF